MLDSYKRHITYLRISVTDRCNLRCTYCMPEEGIDWIPHQSILSLEEIAEVAEVGASLGIKKIRLTGGEPLVRKGIVSLVEKISSIEGIEDLAMTTNGILLPEFAKDLKKAGLHRVNISLDSLDPEKFHRLTRVGHLEEVLAGIQAAKEAGLEPVKINCVVTAATTTTDKEDLRAFCKKENLDLRFIQEMSLEKGEFSVVEGGDGGNCSICNRLRLTAKGDIMPCLFSSNGYNVKELGIENAYKMAVGLKPKSGHSNKVGSFYNIGG